MMLPSIFGENLFDEWMNDSGLMNPNFFGKGHSPLVVWQACVQHYEDGYPGEQGQL